MSKGGVTGTVLVNGLEYSIKCLTGKGDEFSIEAQNLRTGEVWKGDFCDDYIEDLTKKTGSFKRYTVFLDMLTEAIKDSAEHVYIELLTYSDLIALKNGKPSKKKAPDDKRYLILTYKVKYDTVHYPLPLQYSGKMSPVELQDNVTKLQTEINQLKNQIISVSSPIKPQNHSKCCKENAALRQEIEILKKKDGGNLKDQTKMIKTLQNALRNLESDLIREKNKYQRTVDKKNSECKRLVNEVENLRTENRALTVKLRSVTTELNISKRNKLYNISANRRSITPDSRNYQRKPDPSPVDRMPRRRSTSADRVQSSVGRGSVGRSNKGSVGPRGRGSSMERSGRGSQNSSAHSSRSNSRNSAVSAPEIRTRARTPSPAGARFPRFDPSAYIKDKEMKAEEKKRSRERQTKTNTYLPRARSTPLERGSPSQSLYHKPPPSSLVKDIIKGNLTSGRRRNGGSCSSLDSCKSNSSRASVRSGDSSSNRRSGSRNSKTESRNSKKSAQSSGSKNKRKPRYSYPSSGSECEEKENKRSRSRQSKYLNSSTNVSLGNVSGVSFTKDSDIAEIDARLNALQSYLKEAQNKQYKLS